MTSKPTKQRCPKCNRPNELDALRCVHCSAPLVQVCPRCGTQRAWYVTRCARCDTEVSDDAVFTSLFRETPSRLIRGRYLIRETLASGRVSAVYRVVDRQQADTQYALKELSTTALFRAEERRSVEKALESCVAQWSHVSHPNAVRVVDAFAERDGHYVVLEYVAGRSLKRLIEDAEIGVGAELARNWGAQLADLLAHLHNQTPPLYAPFLSPNHVMVTAEGVVKLVDLGLSWLFSPGGYGPYGSTRGYAAPELEREPPGVLTDLFAVGRLLYALLTSQLLEKGQPARLSLRQAVPGLSTQLIRAIAQAAHRDPLQRFASMLELKKALWDEIAGPLIPIAGWAQSAEPVSSPLPSRPPLVVEAPQSRRESMADLGFQRDPRFGPEVIQKESPPALPQGKGKLSLHPHSFQFSDLKPAETKRVVLTMRNSGDGELSARLSSQVDWLKVPQQAIGLPAGKQARILLSVEAKRAPTGRTVEPQAILVETTAGRQWVGASIEIASGPALQVERPLVDFGVFAEGGERRADVTVTNAGRQLLSGQVSARVPWLHVPEPAFRCAPGRTIQVPVVLSTTRLPRGEQRASGALVIDSDGGQEVLDAHAWRQAPVLDLGATHMDLGIALAGQETERYLLVGNTGEKPLEGTVQSLLPWLGVTPPQFTCPPGEMTQLTVSVNTVGLPDGLLAVPQALHVRTNGGTQTLSLRVQVRAPRLAVETPRLVFGSVLWGEMAERTITLRNEGSASLTAHLYSMVDWLTLSHAVIECEPGNSCEISVSANTRLFGHGREIALESAVRIISGNQVVEIPAHITVLRPALHIEPEQIDFGYIDRAQPETRSLTISNEGTGQLAWNIQTDAVWVEASPRAGVCGAGESSQVTLSAYGLALEGDSGEGTLVISSDAGRSKIPLHVGLAAPLISSDTSLLDLGSSINGSNVTGSFRIFNHGLGLLKGTVSTECIWLALDRASFECPMGRSVEITVSTDMSEFPPNQSHSIAPVRVESNGGDLDIEVALALTLAPQVQPVDSGIILTPADVGGWAGKLVLKNIGQALSHVALRSGQDIQLSRSSCEIKPGKSVRIAVQYGGVWPRLTGGMEVVVIWEGTAFAVPVIVSEQVAGTTISPSQKEVRQ